MIPALLTRVVSLGLGTLYPAYASYKAVRSKNVKEYVKWMMYWIMFALFTCLETVTDVLLSFCFPFYYELKVLLLLWLLSPATCGSSLLYRRCVHPWLVEREQSIDAVVSRAQEQGYNTMLAVGHRGVTYVQGLVLEGALRAPGLMAQLVGAGAEQAFTQQQQPQRILPTLTHDLDAVSDDEMDGVPASTPIPREEPLEGFSGNSDEAESDSQSELRQPEGAPTRRGARQGRRKEARQDLELSSGGDDDPDFEPTTKKKAAKQDPGATKKAPAKRSSRKART